MDTLTRLLASLFALALVVSACGGSDAEPAATDGTAGSGSSTTVTDTARPGDDPFGTTTWILVQATVDGTDLDLLDTHPVTLAVDGTDVGGTAACNGYGGTLAAGALLFDGFAVTEMACDPPAAMALESAFLAALGQTTDARVEDGTLVLTGDGIELRFDAEPASPDADLTGVSWVLDTVIDGDTASSVVAGTEPALTFGSDGSVTGSDGCNSLSGSADIDGDEITFGPLAQTRRACEPDVTAQARAITAVLAGTVTFSIEGDQLTLTAPDANGLVYRVA